MSKNTSNKDWGSNTRISIPVPPESPPLIEVGGGFGFTKWGIAHNISEAEVEEMAIPPYSPDSEF